MKRTLVSNLNATRGDEKGEINLSWDSITSAELYVIQFSVSKNGSALKENKSSEGKLTEAGWKTADIINESKYTIRGLKEKKTYLFRVAAVTTSKQGPWSRTVKKVI
jgi:Fibronectin type III domain